MINRGGIIVSHRSYPENSYTRDTACSMMLIGSRPDDHIFIGVVKMDLPFSLRKFGLYARVVGIKVPGNASPSFVVRYIGSHLYTQHWASRLLRVSQWRADSYFRGTRIPFTPVWKERESPWNQSPPCIDWHGVSGRLSVACRVDCLYNTSLYKQLQTPVTMVT